MNANQHPPHPPRDREREKGGGGGVICMVKHRIGYHILLNNCDGDDNVDHIIDHRKSFPISISKQNRRRASNGESQLYRRRRYVARHIS